MDNIGCMLQEPFDEEIYSCKELESDLSVENIENNIFDSDSEQNILDEELYIDKLCYIRKDRISK